MLKKYMRYITLNNSLLLLFLLSMLFCGCKKEKDIVDKKEEKILEPQISESVKIASENGDWTQVQTESGYFLVVPNIFIQDYEDVKINSKKTIGSNGEQIVSLCMIKSFWNNKKITPEEFVEEYKNAIDNNGIVDIDAISDTLVNKEDVEYAKDVFNPEVMVSYFTDHSDTTVLIEIPHNSKYGKGCSYLIITGISDDGYVAIRDPNKWNIEQYAMDFQTMDGEYLYPLADVLCSAGNNSTMYIFRWRQ